MIKKNLKVTVCSFLLGILLAVSAAAYATTSYSSWNYYGPVYGYSYKNQSWVSDYYSGMTALFAGVTCSNQAAGTVPAGYMGCQAQLYDSNNNLIAYSSWSYNSSALNSMGIIRWGDTYNSGYYYSRGKTAAYNGNGYSYYWAYKSPNLYWGG